MKVYYPFNLTQQQTYGTSQACYHRSGACSMIAKVNSLLHEWQLKDTYSCGPINMKLAPHKICPIRSTPKTTDRTDRTVKVMKAKLKKSWKLGTGWHNYEYCPTINNDLVKMASWGCQKGNRACIPKFSSNSICTISPQIHPKSSIFTILGPRLLQLWYMESYRNITMDAPTVFNNTHTIVIMANDKNLNKNRMQKTLTCQPMFNGISWETFKRWHRKVGQPQREK